ncbi:unnamed protein product [Linum tenue]|uniref:AT-hook motif nuclear-localized protein n=1 Tax=Linum tenue TaxID=586396 RepID=A0AAV0J0V6_9ROSI|nr:unnamed protein product [Linum tenue]
MEAATQGMIYSSGVTVRGDEAPESYRVAPRAEISNPNPNSASINPNPVQNNSTQFSSPPPPASSPPGSGGTLVKKKRGRPRKYGPDGSLNPTLSPMPISASIPLTGGDFSSPSTSWKRGRGRAIDSVKKQKQQHRTEHESPGDGVAYSVGANFTPHVLNVNAGEDVTMKVMSFSQQGARAICILSANGTISNVTLRQPTSSGGTLTYEGRFEILSLSGSFMLTETGGQKSRSGGMSVSLAGPDGRVVGGGLAGLLVAAGPVQVVVGSFTPGHQMEQKQKRQRTEPPLPPPPPMVTTHPPVTVMTAADLKGAYAAMKPVISPPSSSFHHGDNTNQHSFNNPDVHMFSRNPPSLDNRSSSTVDDEEDEDDSRGHEHEQSPTHCEVSC